MSLLVADGRAIATLVGEAKGDAVPNRRGGERTPDGVGEGVFYPGASKETIDTIGSALTLVQRRVAPMLIGYARVSKSDDLEAGHAGPTLGVGAKRRELLG